MILLFIPVYFVLGVAIFLATNWLGSHARPFGYAQMSVIARTDGVPAFNFLFRVLTPLALLVLTATLLQTFGASGVAEGAHYVAISYVAIRIAFIIATERASLLNWHQHAAQAGLIIAGSFGVSQMARSDPYALLPDPANMGNELWLVMAVFFYKLVNTMKFSTSGTEERKAQYLAERLRLFQAKYGRLVDALPHRRLQTLAYAVLIYESFNRPFLYRVLERSLLFPLGFAKTLGVMQVQTDRAVTDYDSVRLGTEKLRRDFTTALAERGYPAEAADGAFETWQEYDVLHATAAAYNRDDEYVSEVLAVYSELKKNHFPDPPEQHQFAVG